jgi:pimeloyl-ACP methyl ester carboxylesterase
MIDNLANVSWTQGNATHGPDMYAIFSGTAQDVSLLITHLPGYLPVDIVEHMALGVSLGGHATWQLLLNESRITAGIVVIGCPDYVRLMTDRAIRSKVPSALTSAPAGRDFLGSRDFPPALLQAVRQYDPAGILIGELSGFDAENPCQSCSSSEQKRLTPIIEERIGGKSILCLSGGQDKLVPYAMGKPFLEWLKSVADPQRGWAGDFGIALEDFVDPDAGHEFSAPMRKQSEQWLCGYLSTHCSASPQSGSKL